MTTKGNDETGFDPFRKTPPTRQELLDSLADEFVSRLRAGERPSIQEFQDRYPGLESEIEEVLCSVAMIEDLKRQSETVGKSSSNPFEEVELERIGDYRVVRELGRGGMGIVFEAIHESLGRKVAIKVLPSRAFDGTQAFERFKKEAQAAAKLHHSNIVNVFGVGECDGFHYYVMEYVNGQTMANLVARLKINEQPVVDSSIQDTLPVQLPVFEGTLDRCHWSAEKISLIADALEYSHKNQILHRDIKPGNVLVDHAGKPWITDFGLVKELADQTITKTGEIFGTPQYMAPESFEGKYDQRSEVYCLGLTLYELLAMVPAFFDPAPTRLFKMIAAGSAKSLRQIDPAIPRDLETIVAKAIDRDPLRRYQTAGELRDDLERFNADLPIQARRILPTERAIRWGRRNPLAACLTVLSAVLLLIIAVVSSFAYVSTNQALADLGIKHKELTQQQEETSKAVLRAEANVTLSMKAFDSLFKRIMTKGVGRDIHSKMELETYSELSSLESSVTKEDAEILKGAIQFYKRFTEQNQGNAKLDIEIAKAHRRIANTYHFIGDFEEAQNGYLKAIEAFEKIVAKDGIDINHVVDLAETHNELALAYRKQKRLKTGLDHHEIAKNLLQQESYRDSQTCQFVLANTLNSICTFGNRPNDTLPPGHAADRPLRNLQEVMRAYGKSRPAYLKQAQVISDRLLGSDPENPEYRLLHAKLQRTRAAIFGVDGRKGWQVELLKNSITELENLVKDHPEKPEYKFSLALTQMIRVRNASLETHFVMVEKAEQICSELVNDHPSVMEYLELHFNVTQKLGRIYFNKKEYSQSIGMYEKSNASLLRLTEKSPSILAYYFQYLTNADMISDCHIRNRNFPAAREELRMMIGLIETSFILNGARLKKNEMLDNAIRKLKSLRFDN